jgi:hypothetical protein
LCIFSQAGVSRSATIVLAYLMTIGDYDLEKALQIVKGARGYIHPNPGFISQLRKYHANDVKKVCYLKRILLNIKKIDCFIELELVSFNPTLYYLFI